ncbi:hypothetical protein CONPUDRAFT_159728 [Coniophora puteana RWD-64-598 SS2]|uniref:Uncharacterized protein n=1 Tax=Coniophora puteana (strain RWD-64-598) TaxID=741705 RepID=A0A5M3M6J6_CONPW|nr:uncharacterized protein CONPUDRAFT_159728 [Coniophora puteana RWD-64-598 SS2]EIW74968.1 hypothetical protein CONPUDRAFT_159728 [Coniophora puteana RWD-64-598 SS2]
MSSVPSPLPNLSGGCFTGSGSGTFFESQGSLSAGYSGFSGFSGSDDLSRARSHSGYSQNNGQLNQPNWNFGQDIYSLPQPQQQLIALQDQVSSLIQQLEGVKTERDTLKTQKEVTDALYTKLVKSVKLARGASPVAFGKVPLTGNQEKDLAKLKAAFPKVEFWLRTDYTGWDGDQVGDDEEHGATPYLEDEFGEKITRETVDAIKLTLRSMWTGYAKSGDLLPSWGVQTFDVREEIRDVMYAKYPWLTLCLNDWKLEFLCSKTFPNYKRAKLDDDGNLKIKADNPDDQDTSKSTRKKRSASASKGSTRATKRARTKGKTPAPDEVVANPVTARYPELGAHEEVIDATESALDEDVANVEGNSPDMVNNEGVEEDEASIPDIGSADDNGRDMAIDDDEAFDEAPPREVSPTPSGMSIHSSQLEYAEDVPAGADRDIVSRVAPGPAHAPQPQVQRKPSVIAAPHTETLSAASTARQVAPSRLPRMIPTPRIISRHPVINTSTALPVNSAQAAASKKPAATTPLMPSDDAFKSRAKAAKENSGVKASTKASARKDGATSRSSKGKEKAAAEVPAEIAGPSGVNKENDASDGGWTPGKARNGKVLCALRWLNQVHTGAPATEQDFVEYYDALSRSSKSKYTSESRRLIDSGSWTAHTELSEIAKGPLH